MISATMVGKVLGMVRDILMSYYYGTGMEAQAFFAAARLLESTSHNAATSTNECEAIELRSEIPLPATPI